MPASSDSWQRKLHQLHLTARYYWRMTWTAQFPLFIIPDNFIDHSYTSTIMITYFSINKSHKPWILFVVRSKCLMLHMGNHLVTKIKTVQLVNLIRYKVLIYISEENAALHYFYLFNWFKQLSIHFNANQNSSQAFLPYMLVTKHQPPSTKRFSLSFRLEMRKTIQCTYLISIRMFLIIAFCHVA